MVLVFSYGSNSGPQLRARVQNAQLESRAAILDGYARVFCLRAGGWGGGGVASLCPCDDAKTHGSVVHLSAKEKALLDTFEDGYRQVEVNVRVFLSSKQETTQRATAYVAGDEVGERSCFTPPMTFPPSEPYLTAIHIMLAQHDWDASVVEVRTSAFPDRIVATWKHPGVHGLASLEALAVHLNAHLPRHWEMPAAAFHFASAARDLWNVSDIQSLADRLLRGEEDDGDGCSFLPETEFHTLKEKMRIQLVVLQDPTQQEESPLLLAPVVLDGADEATSLFAASTNALLSFKDRYRRKRIPVSHDRYAWLLSRRLDP